MSNSIGMTSQLSRELMEKISVVSKNANMRKRPLVVAVRVKPKSAPPPEDAGCGCGPID